MLELKDLTIGYGPRKIISQLNANFHPGELVGIIGPNGAGKSTLLKSILGLLPLQQGEIILQDQNIKAYSPKALARSMAYLQQNLNINFGYSAQEIVMAGRYAHKAWYAGESSQDVALVRKCLQYTGTDQLAEVPLDSMSGGQRQRVLLAKVLAQQTPILLLDEPTTGLDIVYQEEIFAFAQELAAMGKLVIMVIHELPLAAKYCDRLLLLGQQRLLADDVPSAVLTEQLLAKAYGVPLQIKRYDDGHLNITKVLDDGQRRHQLLQEICSR